MRNLSLCLVLSFPSANFALGFGLMNFMELYSADLSSQQKRAVLISIESLLLVAQVFAGASILRPIHAPLHLQAPEIELIV